MLNVQFPQNTELEFGIQSKYNILLAIIYIYDNNEWILALTCVSRWRADVHVNTQVKLQ